MRTSAENGQFASIGVVWLLKQLLYYLYIELLTPNKIGKVTVLLELIYALPHTLGAKLYHYRIELTIILPIQMLSLCVKLSKQTRNKSP